jgi:hypothetical protein
MDELFELVGFIPAGDFLSGQPRAEFFLGHRDEKPEKQRRLSYLRKRSLRIEWRTQDYG